MNLIFLANQKFQARWNRILMGSRRGPPRRDEVSDLGDIGRRQALEQIFQIIEGIDPMSSATAQQGVNHRAAFPSFRMSKEQKILFPKSTGPDCILDQVVVDLQNSVSNEPCQRCLAVHRCRPDPDFEEYTPP
jgi:hypothetical protein